MMSVLASPTLARWGGQLAAAQAERARRRRRTPRAQPSGDRGGARAPCGGRPALVALPVDELGAGGLAALDAQRQQAAEAVGEVVGGQVVVGVGGEARVAEPGQVTAGVG
jgi:hypothetical protein